MILPIVAYGDPVLRKRAVVIDREDESIPELIENMFETMYHANGVGLAAPQVGKSIRLFVVDGEPMEEEELVGFKKVFINPTILEESGDPWNFEEGCLSIPHIREDVSREPAVTLRYFDENWEEKTEAFTGLQARIIQHEYDHLEGILFIDHISAFKKRLLKKKLGNISRGSIDIDYRMRFPLLK